MAQAVTWLSARITTGKDVNFASGGGCGRQGKERAGAGTLFVGRRELVDGECDGAGGGGSGVGDDDGGGACGSEVAGGNGYGKVAGIDPGGGAVGAVPGDGCS